MNNILNNMSDFEKIIFVNNINEDIIPDNIGMSPISTQYPFVLFLTNQTINDGAVKISNLWHNGVRLTRFIGIDNDHSTIDLGNGHEVRLDFSYNTGKLGIYDVNPLKSISIVNIGYTNYYDGSILRGGYEDIVVDSINNTFDIYIKFKSGDNDIDDNSDVSKINNELYFYDNESTMLTTDFTVINKSFEEQNLSDKTITYKYICKINKDTFVYNTSNQYKIVSPYSSNVSVPPTGDISLYLNPESYSVESNGIIIPNNGNITYSLDNIKNNSIDLSLNFSPHNITTNDRKKLYVKIKDDSGLISNNIETKYDIVNGVSKISLKVNSEAIESNTSKTIKLKINVYRKIENNELNYPLEKTINITITGRQSNKFIYCGYTNPININFSDLISFEGKSAGIDVLWSWEDHIDEHEISTESTNTFYIAIPSEYANIIKPRIDAYVIKTLNGSKRREYVDNSNAFELISSDAVIANQTFKFYIYISKFNGFYYGKIQ